LATLTASNYFKIRHVEWVFIGSKGGAKNSRLNLFTTVTMVDGDNPYTVEVKVFSDTTTVEWSNSAPIVVNPRSGPQWSLTPTLAPDKERNFGTLPNVNAEPVL
jgi:hypothetical protein